jgi:hypothetical protein
MLVSRRVLLGGVGSALLVWTWYGAAAAQKSREARLAIDHRLFTQPQRRGAPLAIDATITSPAGVRKAEVFCRASGGGVFTALAMAPVGENVYRAVVPDWLMAGAGLEYYITASDYDGQSTSQGFVGFPLVVRLSTAQAPTQEQRLKVLEENLDVLRKSREAPAPKRDPSLDRGR